MWREAERCGAGYARQRSEGREGGCHRMPPDTRGAVADASWSQVRQGDCPEPWRVTRQSGAAREAQAQLVMAVDETRLDPHKKIDSGLPWRKNGR